MQRPFRMKAVLTDEKKRIKISEDEGARPNRVHVGCVRGLGLVPPYNNLPVPRRVSLSAFSVGPAPDPFP
jgi:hypothetical protein